MKEPSIPFNDDMKFLIYCCQTSLNEEEKAYIQNYLLSLSNLKMTTLLEKANQHAIIPLVYKTLSNIESTPSSFLSTLKKHYMHTVRKNMMMSAELIRIMKLLDENDIEALAFKGPTLAQLAYGDITLRQFVDLDILVDKLDVFSAGKIIQKNGYKPSSSLSFLSNETCLNVAKDFSLFNEKNNMHIELHWEIFEKKYNIFLLNAKDKDIYQSISINNKHMKTLKNEFMLIYLCIHGSKHMFNRIEWICDIDRLIRTNKLDWDYIDTILETLPIKRAFYLGLSLSDMLFHTPLPEKIIIKSKTDKTSSLRYIILEQWLENKKQSDFQSNKKIFLFHTQLFDKRRDVLYFYFSTLFQISISDCQVCLLPEKVKLLYFIIRPIRLTYHYLGRILIKN
jgi:hypothetical protein